MMNNRNSKPNARMSTFSRSAKRGLALTAICSMLWSSLVAIGVPTPAAWADTPPRAPIIRDGTTYALDFNSGTMSNGTYNDGVRNAIKFAGDTANVALSGGELAVSPVTGSTVGVFDYGFTSAPEHKYSDFEASFDMTVTQRELNRQLGVQFQKNGWSDGWDAQLKAHITFDAKMNLFEGSTSIANTDGNKYRGLKEYGMPGLNRDTLPWGTFRMKLSAEGNRIRAYVNNSTLPIIDVTRGSVLGEGFVGVFANAATGFRMDNFVFNRLLPVSDRDQVRLAGDTNGFYIFIPELNGSVSKFNIRYRNVTDGTAAQLSVYNAERGSYARIGGLTAGKDYSVELLPVYTSDRTLVDTELTMYQGATVHVGNPLQTQLSLSAGETFYGASQSIDYSVIGADAIRYTLDGSEPDVTHGTEVTGDTIFNGSLTLDHTATLKAVAIQDGQIKARKQETYVAGANPVTLSASQVFYDSLPVSLTSSYADAIIYTLNGTTPQYNAATGTAANGTMVSGAAATITVTDSVYMQALAVRGGVAGAVIRSATYTKVALNSGLVTSWDFTSNTVLHAEEQDELYGKNSAPWSNLLGWDVNSDKGVYANHIVTDNVYRDVNGVHLFTTSEPIQSTTSNPNLYLDTHDAGLQPIPSAYRYVSVWMKTNHTANAAIYFATDAGADTNKLSESRKVAFRNTAAETPEFQRYIIDMGNNPGWTGNITKLRIDPMATYPSMKNGIEIVVKEISLLRKQDLPAEIRLTKFQSSPHEIVSPGDHFQVEAMLENIGADASGISIHLDAPDFVQVTRVSPTPGTTLASGQTLQLVYDITVTGTGAGGIGLRVTGSGLPTTRDTARLFSVANSLPESGQPDDLILGDADKRLVFPSPASTGLGGYGFGWLEAKRAGAWVRIAVLPSLGSVQQIVYGDQLAVRELYAPAPDPESPGNFLVPFSDPEGAAWSGSVSITSDVYGDFQFSHTLQANYQRQIAAIVGPTLLLGEAGIASVDPQQKVITSTSSTTGDYVNEALFPGLEWLDDHNLNNRSSDTLAVLNSSDAFRYVPHPRKITVPLMALRKGGISFGLMWDARQSWDGVHDQPAAFFALPNRLERGEDTVSAKLSLFIPSVLNGVNENATMATGIPAYYEQVTANANNENPVRQPYSLPAAQPISLQSRLFVSHDTEISSTVGRWIRTYGLPEPLAYASGTMQKESKALLGSFENLWLPEQNQWMNRIGPAATPIITSAFVMPYAVLGPYGDAARRTLAEQRVQTAMNQIGTNYSTYGYILPLYLEGIAAKTMEALQTINVDSLIASAKLVNPSSVTAGVYWDYQTYIQKKGFPVSAYMGAPNEVTPGSNAEFAFKMLRQARMTGNVNASVYGKAAMDYINSSFTLPRGSQSWELRNMIPELETAAFAVRANVEAYQITGLAAYLEYARQWADRGLPFVYVWDDGSYGISKNNGEGGEFGSHTFMRYGALAAFGQSIYRSDGKPLPGTWFGRPVQWSGHDYGIALLELEAAMKQQGSWNSYMQNGGVDYHKISLGLSVSGSRQTTAADAEYPRHLYDATSLLKWETSDYLYPNYQGAELLGKLLGSKTSPQTVKTTFGTKEIRVSAAAEVKTVTPQTNELQLKLGFEEPGDYTILVQGASVIGGATVVEGTAQMVSFAARSGSGLGEIHLRVVAEGSSETVLRLMSVTWK
ncbi:FN3 associated domain-containing protein [Paenibacillus sp. 2RAB27]|uniref:chitobiase/beta-hexosaminidase C-terminal domain-containing protein n=1 Tax=Paenibacillus sp. 2RAB27 TaxID=3232991 RepID=UPI003F960544